MLNLIVTSENVRNRGQKKTRKSAHNALYKVIAL